MGSEYVTTRELLVVAEKIDVAVWSSSATVIPAVSAPVPIAHPKAAYANAVKATASVAPPLPSPSLLSLSLADASSAVSHPPTAARPPRPPGPIPAPPQGSGPRPEGPVSQAEREYRWKWWLCAYCADAGHLEDVCPALIARKRIEAGN